MKYYNLKVVVLLKQNLENFETYEKIGNLISYGMLKDKTLKELHEIPIKTMFSVIYILYKKMVCIKKIIFISLI